jgi:arthrofactin-type cyclic lipopeptide synthetase C
VVIGVPVANRTRAEVEPLIGFFINTLALRLDLSGGPTVSHALQRVKKQTLAAQQHQHLPIDQVVEIANPPRDMAYNPLFQVMFGWQNNEDGELELPGLALKPVNIPHVTASFDLFLDLGEMDGRIAGGLQYATALFDRGTIERYCGYLRNLLRAMTADDQLAVDRLPLLGESERHQLLVEWNAADAVYPRGHRIHELFETRAALHPDSVAVAHEESRLSYGELNSRANRLAHHLRALGVGPDALVALCVERSPEMIVGLLGILKAGGAYVPLDPAYPAERLAYMLEDSAPVAVLTHARIRPEIRSALAATAAPLIDLEADAEGWAEESDCNPDPAAVGLRPEHLAYVIYTSGSTGRPKGVMVEHANLIRLLSATREWFEFDHTDVWTLFHSLAFDFSVWEIWGALAHGGRLVIVSHLTSRSPEEFYRLLCEGEVTALNQTPSAFRQLMAAQEESRLRHRLRYVIFGGEALEVSGLRAWYERRSNQETRLINMYGITETTVHVSYRALERSDTGRVGSSPIGRRIPDLKVYLLDRHGQPVPIGVSGEMYIGGAGVARGYLNRPELTAERFVAGWAESWGGGGARVYKSGDLGRYCADGSIEYLGRNDFQVKIRGFRIELGEIEARLAQHPGVREAVVAPREESPGDKRLVAYYTTVGDEEAATVDAERLRAHMSAQLPEYMTPAAYVRLEAMPITANGKLDRRALPEPEGAVYASREYEAPEGEIEIALARIWAETLKVERVGRQDNFFELGGHSLLAVSLIQRMRKQGLHIDLNKFLVTPTLAALASAVIGESDIVQVPTNRIPSFDKKVRI